MVNGLPLCHAFLTSGDSKRFTIMPNIHQFTHTCTQRRRCRPRQGNSLLVGSSQGEGVSLRDTLTLRSRGIELATFRLPADPLYLLSHVPPRPVLQAPARGGATGHRTPGCVPASPLTTGSVSTFICVLSFLNEPTAPCQAGRAPALLHPSL